MIIDESGEILLHCQNTVDLFKTKEKNLIGLNYWELMSRSDKNFFKTNCFTDYHLYEMKSRSQFISAPIKTRTIRFSTPHSEDTQLYDINVLTSKLIKFEMNMTNLNDQEFMNSNATKYIDKSCLGCFYKYSLIKVYTQKSSFDSMVKYYNKIRDAKASAEESIIKSKQIGIRASSFKSSFNDPYLHSELLE